MRLGLHVHSSRDAHMTIEYARRVQPPFMKFIDDDAGLMAAVKEVSPNTKIVYRHVWDDQNFARYGDFVNHMLGKVGPLRGVADYFEGWNEFTSRDRREQEKFSRLEVEYARKMLDVGMGAAIGGFSTGFLDERDWYFDAARPILEMCHRHGGDNPTVLWHSHEYSGPYMGYGTVTPDLLNQWDHPGDRFAGHSTDPNQFFGFGPSGEELWGWWTLRYKKLWEKLEEEGLTGVRMFLSETGIDDVNPRPGGPGKGWRDWKGTNWESIPGQGDIADQFYWYLWHISMSPYVVGVVDFGFADISGDWTSFDFSREPGMFDKLMRRQTELPIGAQTAPPNLPPDPIEETLHESYDLHVVKGGDTLYRLALDHLGLGSRWPEILRAVPMGEPRQLPVGSLVLLPRKES